MEQNLISVIMPVYKTEESHLRKAIESVINQATENLKSCWSMMVHQINVEQFATPMLKQITAYG